MAHRLIPDCRPSLLNTYVINTESVGNISSDPEPDITPHLSNPQNAAETYQDISGILHVHFSDIPDPPMQRSETEVEASGYLRL